MRLLLDTHVILWGLEDSPRLGSHIRALIADPANTVFVSVISVWEISIKASLNKLQITTDLETYLHATGFTILPVLTAHALAVRHLPWHHRDPFDRMLVAQACVEKFTLLSSDTRLQNYEGLALVML